ncbi:insulinase family protein [bacterium]|nr:insulinase family protein [bacterium]
MKVGNIHPVLFKASQPVSKPDNKSTTKLENKELQSVTPNYNVKSQQLQSIIPGYNVRIPQKYNLLGIDKLKNGLEVHSYKLANGYRVTIVPMEGSPTTVKNYVNVGSMNETDDIKGISHFLEHMAFNGTNGENGYIKLDVGDSFKKIDNLGGWTNASTNYAITDYVNSTPMLEEKDLEEQIKIIAGMTEDLALTPEMIEKEKGPVCSEINMILDRPQTIVFDQTVRTLFNIQSSADELVGGSTQHIKNLTKEKVKAYYDKYYTPNNMNLVITGDVNPQKAIELVAKNFHSKKKQTEKTFETKLNPIEKTTRKDFITDKARSTEIVLGFAGPNSNDSKSSVIFDILAEHLGSVEVGFNKEFRKINARNDYGIEKISNNPNSPTMLYYGITCSDQNSEKALKIAFDKISALKAPSEENLKIIKERLLQKHNNSLQYSSFINSRIGNGILDGTPELLKDYEKIIENITVEDLNQFIKKYYNLNKAAVTLVHPETNSESIIKNYKDASTLNFKGRAPINTNKISETTLENNYKVAQYETNNENMYFNITLKHPVAKDFNAATRIVLDELYSMGTEFSTEDEFDKYKEQNNVALSCGVGINGIDIFGFSNQNNFIKNIEKAKELLYNPRLTQSDFDEAKNKIKDSILRRKDTATSTYATYESERNPYYVSREKLLKDLDKLTLDEVKEYHKYILANSTGIISSNVPTNNSSIKKEALSQFSTLKQVNPYEYKKDSIYKTNEKAKVLTKESSDSQADISQIYKFKFEENTKEYALLEIMNTLLSSSSSIGLFNTLREKEHLAYSVYSTYDRMGDCAELSCNILTTTDNKEIGEFSYDNVQKSIKGFHRQINSLLNSEYTDEDLESAKRTFKAMLLNKEGIPSKLDALNNGLDSLEGIDFENKLYDEIDKITRADIDKFAQKVFKNPPVYSIVASKDTLNANKEFFKTLEF